MRGKDGDKPEADDNMGSKDPGAWAYKEPVIYNFDMSQPLIGPVPAKVLSVSLHAVFLTFTHEEEEQVAVMTPGKMFINGSENLLNFARAEVILRQLLSDKDDFSLCVKKLTSSITTKVVDHRKQNQSQSSFVKNLKDQTQNQTEKEKKKGDTSEVKETKIVNWGVTVLSSGSAPEMQQLQGLSEPVPEECVVGWQSTSERVCTELLVKDEEEEEEAAETTEENKEKNQEENKDENKEENKEENTEENKEENMEEERIQDSWFLISMSGVNSSNIPDKYPGCDQRNVRGVVTEVFRPFGGVVDVGPEHGGKITFHRNVIFKNGSRLGVTKTLEDSLKVGDNVVVDITKNSDDDDNVLLQDAGGKVASAVYLDEIVEEVEHPELESYGQSGHKVRIVALYENEEDQVKEDGGPPGMMSRGLGCIQYSQFMKSGKGSSSMVGEFVTFAREDLYFHGVRLSDKVDLGHILAVGDFISCHLKMLDTKQGRAQFVCKLGWLDSASSPVARSLLASESPELHRWCATKGLNLASVERILAGEAGLKGDLETSDMAVGHVIELDSAENYETLAKGLIKIDAGPHKGRVVRYARTKATLFGMKLDKADLLYIVRPSDRVYCELSGINDYPEGQYMSQKVQFHSLMADSEKEVTDPLTELTGEERLEFLFWLDIHHNTWHTTSPGSFKSVLAGNAPTRYFIPFPRDACPFPGRVVSFDPPKSMKKSFGCTSGTIVLDQGSFNLELEEVEEGEIGVKDMKDVKVTFHRSCFWIYGRKMAKADLSHVLQPNQKVTVECRRITEEDRKQHPSLPLDIEFRATIIWIGPCRPRNDREDPNRSCPGVFQWLSRRGMNINQFSKLVDGRVPPHTPDVLDHKGFFLAPPRGEGASLSGRGGTPERVDKLPVLRHGPMIAHILDTAITCTGPQDPRLFTLLENDQMAQGAHHVSEALRYAIQYYKEATGGLNSGFGMGYGSSGPPQGGKRPYDYNNYGGGYSRPPKNPRY